MICIVWEIERERKRERERERERERKSEREAVKERDSNRDLRLRSRGLGFWCQGSGFRVCCGGLRPGQGGMACLWDLYVLLFPKKNDHPVRERDCRRREQPRPAFTALSHRMYRSNGLRISTPPKHRRLVVLNCNSEQ